ncbi:MAG: EAL domain-containing protein [Methylotenera sp.]|nr:EAL domain-containing protein [Methylotenera sp.]
MSLIKQLWLAILLVLALASGGSFVLSTVVGKHAIEQQLQMKNEDNATTLALSMTQLPKDPVTLDLLLSAQFDAGHYRYIGLLDPNGQIVSERNNVRTQTKAPAWFVKLIPLDLHAGVAEIQEGWSQYGTLKLESDPNFAYDRLWDATILIALWALLIGLISCYVGGQILRRILSPLNDVVNQAKSIGESQFVMIPLPKTKEFKQVVSAMNTLSNRVKKTVSEESARLDQLRFENNFDHITGLMNHDYFAKKIDASISHEEYFNEGVFIVSRVSNLAEVDQNLGYQETNALLRRIGDALNIECENQPHLSAGRLSGADFVVFSSQAIDCYALGNQIKNLLQKVSKTSQSALTVNFITAATPITKADNVDKMIAVVHHILDDISAKNTNILHIINTSERNQHQNTDQNTWHHLLVSALDNKRIRLESYPVINQAGKLIHNESPVRLQLEPEGKWYCAGEFITWATQLNLMSRVDELVLETAIALLDKGAKPIGLNVSASAICNTEFIEKAVALIKRSPDVANRLFFEVPEQSAFDHLSEFRNFCSQLKALGCNIGIEHVGSRISRLGELHDIGLTYIKIDASIIRDININEANKTLLRGLCMIAHSIGVIAIAEGVQTSAELASLKQIGLDGVTGPGVAI